MASVVRNSAPVEASTSAGALQLAGSVGFEPTDGGISTVTDLLDRRDKPLRQLPTNEQRASNFALTDRRLLAFVLFFITLRIIATLR